ncbi:MAG: LD-carboxypeptidase [Alphaproteobacteria bacterium]|nr:LD-carboxypeptidase [Alphaproteobacteria bacterium]
MLYPSKLKQGSHIRVIAPSRSFKIISDETREIAKKRFADMGITVSYSKHCDEIDDFVSSSIASRLEDLHEAFADKSVDGILTAIGGFNTNQLIDKIDYNLIKNNPKILCGFSDITCLCHAITAKTDVVTYSGPHFSSFGMAKGFDYTLDYFKKCLFNEEPYQVFPTKDVSNDAWFMDQENRTFTPNDGFWVLNEGQENTLTGKLIGGHVRCLSSLQGTKFWPSLKDCILFLEEDEETNAVLFDRLLQSLIHQEDFKYVKALIIGRFRPESEINRNLLEQIIQTKDALKKLPVIANFDIGHSTPIITYPIGGQISLTIRGRNQPIIKILEH